MAASLVQAKLAIATATLSVGSPVSLSASATFSAPTTDGNGLICVLTGSVFYNGGGEYGHRPSLSPPTTTGIAWTLAAANFFVEESNDPTLVEPETFKVVAVYYATAAPSISGATSATLTGPAATVPLSSAICSISVAVYEVSGMGSVESSAVASVSNQYIQTRLLYPPATHVTTAPIGAATAGDFVIVAACVYGSGSLAPGAGFTGSFSGIQYQISAAGSIDPGFSSGSMVVDWACIAVAFGLGGYSGGVSGVSGCGTCTGPHLLNIIPGFSDLPDSVLSMDDPTFALHLGEIAFNASFGMVRLEVFPCILKHGDTVPLPVSCADGYPYSREELIYLWTVASSTDPSSNWISGPDCLWFTNWNVDQKTGVVFSEEWYERSSGTDNRMAAKSNDGAILVYTIGQRQKTNMIMAAPASYTAIDEAGIAPGGALTQALAQQLNENAKFSVVGTEVFYLGEYIDGQTVTLPTSRVDGYVYSAAECKFMHSWRWTAQGSSYTQPPSNYDQLCPFTASIDSSGVVAISVKFMHSGDAFLATGYGRIAAFAFARRSATPSSATLANNFTELDFSFFVPGQTLRASTVLAIKRNIDEAILSPEFFGPTEYKDADVIPLPVSSVDGYAYSREECQYVWSWKDTTNQTGTHLRLPLFLGNIDHASGTVTLNVWRLPPGGPFIDDNNTLARIEVIVVANRETTHPELIAMATAATPTSDSGSYVTDNSNVTVNGS